MPLRWLNTVFKIMENSRFRFLDNYYLLINKKYLTYIKQHLTSLNFCTKVMQQDGGYLKKLCNKMFILQNDFSSYNQLF
jgi:hypothetical protein